MKLNDALPAGVMPNILSTGTLEIRADRKSE
jgi:hypothetical protein